jgi:hypothetical protein
VNSSPKPPAFAKAPAGKHASSPCRDAYWRAAPWHAAAVAVVLGLVAWWSPPPFPTDQLMMERVGQHVISPGCADLNCFRILVPAALEALPGPSLPRWRTYAVVANSGAALAAGLLSIHLGLSVRAALLTLWLCGLAAGSMGTVHHPYNADSLVLSTAPIVTLWLVSGRRLAATALATIGVLAKEFAAAPMFIVAGAAALRRDWRELRRGLALAFTVLAFWVALHVALMALFNYGYNQNPSSQPLAGGYLAFWLQNVTPATAVFTVFGAYGALNFLLPVGFWLAPGALRQLSLAAIPAAAAFVYVATPDRALGNFFFLVVPIAAIVLAALPLAASIVFVICFGLANLRLGAQLPEVPASRYALLASSAIAIAAIVATWKSQRALLPS